MERIIRDISVEASRNPAVAPECQYMNKQIDFPDFSQTYIVEDLKAFMSGFFMKIRNLINK